MVYDLSLFGYQVEMTVHLVIVEGTDAGRALPKCLSGEIQAVANSACFKMRIAITTGAIGMCGTLKITNHRKGHAGVTGQVLPQAQTSGRYPLGATLHLFQLGTPRPEPIIARV